ncbi:MAG: hypothetical protein LBW77_03865, partial [Verrucomicrobiota bacterium]|nr:hypothetical protein [Verrucomicrobiota bacterium]
MKRVITGILVGAAWLAAIVFLPKWAMCAVLAVMSCLCQREFYGLMRLRGYEVCPKLGMALGTVWIALVSGSRLFKWLYF